MFQTLLHLATAVAMAKSALECSQCSSAIGWNDCMKHATKENCTHYCFLLEEMDSSAQTIHFKQGCTDDRNFCAEQSSEPNSFCSLCSEDKTLCISLSHRLTGIVDQQVNDTTSKPSQSTASAVVTLSANKDGPNSTSSFEAMIQEQLFQGKQESQIWLKDLVDHMLDNSNRNSKSQVHSENRANVIETTETSLEKKKIFDNYPVADTMIGPKAENSTENVEASAAIGPPKQAAVSGSSSFANAWMASLVIALNFVILIIPLTTILK